MSVRLTCINGREGPLLGSRASTPTGGHMVVTGAAGFIGSHLTEQLLRRGRRVTALDRFDDWYPVAHKEANLARSRRWSSCHLERIDVTHADLAPRFTGADVVFHLAGRAGVQDSWGAGFTTTARHNVVGTQAVLEAALAAGVRRVVVASSSSVYGDSAGLGGDRSVRPISPYGVSKAAAEQLVEAYRTRGLDVVVLRYFTVYGPRQRPDMAIHRIIHATRPGGAVFERRGDGLQRREMTFVGDVVDATIAAGELADVPPVALDVGGGAALSLNEIIDLVEQLVGRPARVRTVAAPAGDPRATVADLDTTASTLGWTPTTRFLDGLAAQVAHQADDAAAHRTVPGPTRSTTDGVPATSAAG